MMVGSLRWQLKQNDIVNEMRQTLAEYRKFQAWRQQTVLRRWQRKQN